MARERDKIMSPTGFNASSEIIHKQIHSITVNFPDLI